MFSSIQSTIDSLVYRWWQRDFWTEHFLELGPTDYMQETHVRKMQPRVRARAQICSPYMTVLLPPGPAPSDFDRIDGLDGLDGIEF